MTMSRCSTMALLAAALTASAPAAAREPVARPTIVLVHGAFAGSSSWNPVVTDLAADGYRVVAVANPLRSLAGDADYVARIVKSIDGPVVLVGHSYGGEVIAVAATKVANVTGLVFVSGLAPDTGESAASLGAKFPTGTLGQALASPVVQANGDKDLYIEQAKYWAQFAADVPKVAAIQMAATQRPITEAALAEGASRPAWRTIPSWFIYGSLDRNIPPALHAFMAQRANAKASIEVEGSSHVVMLSHPREVTELIERAAAR